MKNLATRALMSKLATGAFAYYHFDARHSKVTGIFPDAVFQGPSLAVADRVQRGVHTALGSHDQTATFPFVGKLFRGNGS